VDSRDSLLSNIKGGIVLKKVGERKIEAIKPETKAPNSVAEILSRRIAIQGSDDEAEEDEGNWSD